MSGCEVWFCNLKKGRFWRNQPPFFLCHCFHHMRANSTCRHPNRNFPCTPPLLPACLYIFYFARLSAADSILVFFPPITIIYSNTFPAIHHFVHHLQCRFPAICSNRSPLHCVCVLSYQLRRSLDTLSASDVDDRRSR